MLCSFFISLPRDLNPVTAIELIFKQIAIKVNLPVRSDNYKRLASVFSVLLVLSPLALIISQLYKVVLTPWLLDFSLLFLMLSWHDKKRIYNTVYQRLLSNKETQSKFHLQQITLRETRPLSQLGVHKNTSEYLILQLCSTWFTVLFWYFVARIYGALFYRIMQICSQQWNAKIEEFKTISLLPRILYSVMLFPVHLLLSFTFLLYTDPIKYLIDALK